MSRIQHKPTGDPCECGAAFADHIVRQRVDSRDRTGRVYRRNTERIIGIDGEGEGRRPHLYTYLSAASADSQVASIHRPNGLSTEECLNLIVNLPQRALIVGFAFNYDLTKILQDIPDEKLYYLFHEEKRAVIRDGRIVYRAVAWEGYRLNYMNRRFTVQRGKTRITIWDLFTFFQSKFTQALRDWKIVDEAAIKFIEEMKDKRSNFANVDQRLIHIYCDLECKYLSMLGRELIKAHNDVGLSLQHYYGAGSTASALLTKLQIKEKRGTQPDVMRDAIARSFFGGRFENSVIGPVKGTVYNADISSAYPYQTTFLPCLEHGQWSHSHNPTMEDLHGCTAALVRWTIGTPSNINAAFGPYPVRARNGTIAFPLSAEGGWVWRDEFTSGQKLEPNARALEAWPYTTACDCRPFSEIPVYYRERVRIGKESKGIVLKLGPNAVYGKVAQSKGLNPPFQSWVWASLITSGCRSQLLDLMATAEDPWDVLMLATDGVWSRKPLKAPTPRDTGTFDLPKPLGGWEQKSFPAGVFCVRPGIYFPMNPTEEQLKEVRARGIGKKALLDRWQQVIAAWERGADEVEMGGLDRFVGAKSSIHQSMKGYTRSPDYGEWISHQISVKFHPAPKRERVLKNRRLAPWRHFDWLSEPYQPATKSPEAVAMELAEMIASEQPDCEFLDADERNV